MNLKEIGEKRQAKRKETDLYKVKEDKKKPKFYILDMFPYPSGAGLHVGHPKGYIATDTIARKKILEGYSVIHPMGFDTFGLGTENYAIEHKMKPQDVAKQNISTYIKQLELFGCTYDRSRSVNTADPKYFKRTQRIFLQLYDHYYDEKEGKALPISHLKSKIQNSKLKIEGDIETYLNNQRLAYVDFKPINWCPKCMTGLANEDLDDGKCERCGSEVEQKPMKQRVLRITKYAERLLEGLDKLNREESMKELERNRIGKSEGTEFTMEIVKSSYPTPNPSPLRREGILPKLHIGSHMIELARELRKKATNAEQFLREILRDKSVGYKFRRQHPIANYIADFYCAESKLVVELDGGYHNAKEQKEADAHRDEVMKDYGINVIRFKNKEVLDDTEKVINKIVSALSSEEEKNTSPLHGMERGAEGRVRLSFEIYTTRVDTVFGMSFVAIAPEHALVDQITTPEFKKQVEEYKEKAKHKTQLERTELQKDKTGQFTGSYAINPFNNQKVPIYVADYVLANYGTGVVMAVPAHDERDFEFAKKYNLPIKQVIDIGNVHKIPEGKDIPEDFSPKNFDNIVKKYEQLPLEYTYKTTSYKLINSSDQFNKLNILLAQNAMQAWLEKKKIGGKKINYKIQDRVFSRQRYRGEPFPILRISEQGTTNSEQLKVIPLTEKDLPLELPDVENYQPTGTTKGPLANITDRVNVTLLDGTTAKRETNTMPGRAGSSRYRLRYMDPDNNDELVSPTREKYRGNVNVYVGGAEHVTRHMIYARFFQKFLHDIKTVSQDEPFLEYHSVGLIMGEDGRKMSKRRGNVVNPDDIINKYGADTLRTYEMFMGPFDQSIARNTNGIKGIKKFLDKIVNLSLKVESLKPIKSDFTDLTDLKDLKTSGSESPNMNVDTLTLLNQTVKKIGEDIDGFKFNTAISQLMILVNHLTELPTIDKKTFETLVILISPFAPHLAEELREQMGNSYSIFTTSTWPKYDEKYLVSDTIKIGVQFNGKVRGDIQISAQATQDEVITIVKADPKLSARLTSEPKKIIYIPGKILNIVI